MSDPERPDLLPRRRFLRDSAGLLAGAALAPAWLPRCARAAAERPRVAAIVTEFTYRSHAHVLLENFLNPYLFNGEVTSPGVEVVSLYVDQFPRRDMARDVAKQYGIPIYKTIGEAVRNGGDTLAVDAVLAIGEHGDYPVNAKGQREYPRKRFFDEVVAVFEQAGRGVPYFNDKHLSFRWDWAKEMVDTANRLGFPMMAGSSVPLAQRRPPLEIAAGTPMSSAVSIHAGPVESYDFHGLEVLQSMVENRRGGETGVGRVQFVEGDAVWDAAEAGRWSPRLAEAALAAGPGPKVAPLREGLAKTYPGSKSHAILIDYKDGLKAIVLKAGEGGTTWHFAADLADADVPAATSFYVGPWNNRNLFKALSHAIQSFFRTGVAPYPVERTLLTSGMLDAAMDSRLAGGKPIDTPQLEFAYQPRDYRPFREMGKTWEILTEDTPEPKGLDPSGRERSR